jgi:NAD-dependent dihydropyrimidine dehydrogenase PreA subunit
MPAKVNAEECTACGKCVEICPVDAVKMVNDVAVIDPEECTDCGACIDECPVECISLE